MWTELVNTGKVIQKSVWSNKHAKTLVNSIPVVIQKTLKKQFLILERYQESFKDFYGENYKTFL